MSETRENIKICKHGWEEGPGYRNKCLDCEAENAPIIPARSHCGLGFPSQKKYYSGCGCEAHPDFDFCVDCRIAELEEQLDIGPCATCQRERDIAEEGRAELEARLAAVAEIINSWERRGYSDLAAIKTIKQTLEQKSGE